MGGQTFFAPGTKTIAPLTDFRAALQQVTVLAILAVDFHVFPRRLAKTETAGFSMMDAGVGLFALNSGITAGVHDAGAAGLRHALRTVATTALLGAARLAAVKLSGYPEHAREYGTHWNFFFTLAAVGLVIALAAWPLRRAAAAVAARTRVPAPAVRQAVAAVAGAALVVLHQWLLGRPGVAAWVLRAEPAEPAAAPPAAVGAVLGALPAPVRAFAAQNREGLCSLLGFAGLVFFGECFGCAFFRPLRALAGGLSPLLRPSLLLAHALKPVTVALACVLARRVLHEWPVSRVLVTAPYVVLCCVVALVSIAAFNGVWWVLSLITADMPSSSTSSTSSTSTSSKGKGTGARGTAVVAAPTVRVLEGISTNLLATFLIANVLTGGVNFAVNSLAVPRGPAFAILAAYALVLALVTALFSRFGLRIKL